MCLNSIIPLLYRISHFVKASLNELKPFSSTNLVSIIIFNSDAPPSISLTASAQNLRLTIYLPLTRFPDRQGSLSCLVINVSELCLGSLGVLLYRQTYSCCLWYIINYGFCIAPSYRQTYIHLSLFLKTYLSIYLFTSQVFRMSFIFYLLACFGYNGNEKEAAAKKTTNKRTLFTKEVLN